MTSSKNHDQLFLKNLNYNNERHIPLYSMQRAYILRNELADLETALVKYTLNYLSDNVISIFP